MFDPGYSSYNVAKRTVFRLWDFLGFANPAISVLHLQPGIVDTVMNGESGAYRRCQLLR